MIMRTLILVAMLAGCAMPQANSRSKADAGAESESAASAKQGTNSMPIIVICNQINSAKSQCAVPSEDGAIHSVINQGAKK